MKNGELFEKLLHVAMDAGINNIVICNFEACKGALCDGTIGLNGNISLEEINLTLAHEIAHAFLHYDKGDTIRSSGHLNYEEQADRAAQMLLKALAS